MLPGRYIHGQITQNRPHKKTCRPEKFVTWDKNGSFLLTTGFINNRHQRIVFRIWPTFFFFSIHTRPCTGSCLATLPWKLVLNVHKNTLNEEYFVHERQLSVHEGHKSRYINLGLWNGRLQRWKRDWNQDGRGEGDRFFSSNLAKVRC